MTIRNIKVITLFVAGCAICILAIYLSLAIGAAYVGNFAFLSVIGCAFIGASFLLSAKLTIKGGSILLFFGTLLLLFPIIINISYYIHRVADTFCAAIVVYLVSLSGFALLRLGWILKRRWGILSRLQLVQ